MVFYVMLLTTAPVIIASLTTIDIFNYIMRFLYFSLFTTIFIVLGVSQFYDKVSLMQLSSILYFIYLIFGFMLTYSIRNFGEIKQKGLTFILNMILCKV